MSAGMSSDQIIKYEIIIPIIISFLCCFKNFVIFFIFEFFDFSDKLLLGSSTNDHSVGTGCCSSFFCKIVKPLKREKLLKYKTEKSLRFYFKQL